MGHFIQPIQISKTILNPLELKSTLHFFSLG
jgi:hypothetical protein